MPDPKEFGERLRGMRDQALRHRKRSNARAGQFKLEVPENPLANGEEPAGSGVFLGGTRGGLPHSLLLEEDFHAVGAEGPFVLPDNAALGPFENLKQIG